MVRAAGTASAGITRFNFISGRPGCGMRALARVLRQNPRFSVRVQSGAAALCEAMTERLRNPGSPEGFLDEGQRKALLRGMFEAVHHDRRPGSLVFDCDEAWLGRVDALAALFPLARFVLLVDGRRPAHPALGGPAGERILAVDTKRLQAEPETVLAALYRMLREPGFVHDTGPLAGRLPEAYRTQAVPGAEGVRPSAATAGGQAVLVLDRPVAPLRRAGGG